MIALPVSTTEPFHEFDISLDGAVRTVIVRYHDRESRYYLTLLDSDGSYIQRGVKVICADGLLKYRDKLPGQLVAIANGPDDSSPAFGELGLPSDNVRVNLWYLSADEVRSLYS